MEQFSVCPNISIVDKSTKDLYINTPGNHILIKPIENLWIGVNDVNLYISVSGKINGRIYYQEGIKNFSMIDPSRDTYLVIG